MESFNRKMDDLGRLVIPNEMQKALDILPGQAVNISFDPQQRCLMIRKSCPCCCCCGTTADLKPLPFGKYICTNCLKEV